MASLMTRSIRKISQFVRNLIFFFAKILMIDSLTMARNREYLLYKLEKYNSGRPEWNFSKYLVLFDIDNLMMTNDMYGHVIGDMMIKLLKKSITKNVSKKDIIARIGGDEFLLLTKRIDYNDLVECLKIAKQDYYHNACKILGVKKTQFEIINQNAIESRSPRRNGIGLFSYVIKELDSSEYNVAIEQLYLEMNKTKQFTTLTT